ncbi:hypothetical protein H5410_012974, partial [Solanum commersonii]
RERQGWRARFGRVASEIWERGERGTKIYRERVSETATKREWRERFHQGEWQNSNICYYIYNFPF